MACGGCSARRVAIARAITAVTKGDTETAADQVKFVGRTMAQDAKAIAASKIAAAKQRLTRR